MARLINILVTDDEEGIRNLLFDVLSNKGFRVTLAKDGQDSLNQMKRRRFDLLITDINSSVDALVQRSRARGIVEGRASQFLELKYVSGSDDVRVGDLVVTSGLCGIFPRGLPIGTVSSVEKSSAGIFQHVELRPSAHLNRLEEVSVLFEEQQ